MGLFGDVVREDAEPPSYFKPPSLLLLLKRFGSKMRTFGLK